LGLLLIKATAKKQIMTYSHYGQSGYLQDNQELPASKF